MALQVRIQEGIDSPIAVPWSTGSPEFDSQSDVWLYRIPHPDDNGVSEYVVTPIRRLQWQDLWTITLITKDSPGILGRTAEVLAKLGVNIVAMNTSTIDLWQHHSTRLLVDCSQYKSEVDKNNQTRVANPNATLARLKRLLTVEFIAEIIPPPYPGVAIERCTTFWSLHRQCLRASFSPDKSLPLIDGAIALPQEEIDRLRAMAQSPANLRLLINVDRSGELLHIFPFEKGQGIVSLVLSVINRPGSVAAIATCLGKSGFNILASKAWSCCRTERTELWLLLRSLGTGYPRGPDREVSEDVISALKSAEQVNSFDLRIEKRPEVS